MIYVRRTTGKYDTNEIEVIGDSVSELIDEMSKRIRVSSWPFYESEIKQDLSERGSSIIDKHAGGGSHYTVVLRPQS